MTKVIIYIAAHKPFKLPTREPCYHILQVGAANATARFGEYVDDAGDNISALNPIYCELTGYYWMFKNAEDCDYIGLMHYRRFLGKKKYAFDSNDNILSEREIVDLMKDADFLVPTPLTKKNELNSLYTSDKALAQDRSYGLIRRAMTDLCPEYLDDLRHVFQASTMFFGNILVASRSNFQEYVEWLFRLEDRIVALIRQDGGDVLPRELGYFSEWLLNVYLEHHKQFRTVHLPVHFTEKQNDLKYTAKVAAERMGLLPLLASA